MKDVRGGTGLGLLMLLVGLLVSIGALFGWAAGLPFLYRFGLPWSFWPMAALGNVALGIGQALAFGGQRRLGTIVLTVPILIGVLTMFEYLAGVPIGIDLLLFLSTLEAMGVASAGRISVLAALSLIATAAASLIALFGNRRQEILTFGLCAVVMGFGWLSAGLLFAGFGPEIASQPVRLASALPSAIAMVCLACVPFAYRAGIDPDGLFGLERPSADAIRLGLPILLVLPAALLPLAHVLAGRGFTAPFTAYVVALVGELVIGVVLVGLGVLRISRGHAALRESEERLEHALEAHRVGLFDWQLRSDRLRWSLGAEDRMGVAPGTLADLDSWMNLVVSEDAARVLATMNEAVARKQDRYAFQYRMRRADGDIRLIEGSARCFYDEHGALERVTGVNLDVTDRLRHEAEIARREAQWLSILQAVPDAMIAVDRGGIVKTFSAAAERMFGYSADAVIGRNALMLLPETDARVAMAQLALGMVPGGAPEAAAERVFTGQRAGGTQFPAEYSFGQAMVDGEPLYTVFVRDITDRQAAERRFAALQADFAHSARLNAVGELASGLAHELNQPLAAGANFLGTAELLLEGMEESEGVTEMVSAANAQLLRAGEIIRRLRDFIAKTDADMRVEPLEEVLREAAALALVGARQQQIEIDYRIDPGAQAILADRIQIQQVVVNLVRNAAQALRAVPSERRRITIAARPIDAEMLEVSIADQGRGLPREILEQLFAPFRSTKQGEGLGIGLSICRRIIEAHGGTLDATNLPEGGARFAFTLSRVTEEQGTEETCVTSMS